MLPGSEDGRALSAQAKQCELAPPQCELAPPQPDTDLPGQINISPFKQIYMTIIQITLVYHNHNITDHLRVAIIE
ncbi:hypothetical protein M0804_007092 [Polistes exclamans]|nr:hypothetical protein M0804_007092 [Polistes exclamans]